MITKDRFTTIAMTVVVWGLAGGVFGALFSGLVQVLTGFGLTDWQPLVGAAAAAALATSALYSAMPVALAGAMAGVLASIGSLIAFGHDLALNQVVGAAALTGLAFGSFYAWMQKSNGRPLVEALIGLSSGLIAGVGLVTLVATVGQPLGTLVLAAGVVAVVGTIFQLSQRWMQGCTCAWVPASLSAGAVAALVAVLVAAGIWVLGDAGSSFIDSGNQGVLVQAQQEIPPGFVGGLVGGVLTALVLVLAGVHVEEHE